jgi:O-antigen/teichoic acid export membrane protein
MSEASDDYVGRTAHRDDLSTMARGTGVALLGGLLGSVLGWISQLLLARLLGPGRFGAYAIGFAMVSIASQVSTIGLASAAIYFVARYGIEEAAKSRDVLVQSIGASLFIGLSAGFLLFVLSPLIAEHIVHRPELASALRIFALSIGFAAGFKVARAATTVSYRISYRVGLDVLSNGTFLIFFLAFYLLGGRLRGAALAYFLSSFLGFAASVYSQFRLFPEFFAATSQSSLRLKELFAYSMPAFAASLFWAPQGWMDRFLIGYFRPPAEVGLYQAAWHSASPLYVISFAVTSIAAPMIATLYNRSERARLQDAFRVSSKWILYSTVLVFTVIAAGPRDVLKMFFGPRYQEGVAPLVLLSIAAVIDSADGAARPMLLLTGHQKALLRISAVGMIMQFVLDLYLIPRYGIAGAAIAEVIVGVVLTTSKLLAVNRLLGMSPYDRRNVKGLLAAIAAGIGLYLIRPHGISFPAIRLILRAVLAVAIFAAAMLAVGVDLEDKQVVVAIWEKYFGRDAD